jgi:N-acetyl-anhydromuramyl-L-alanine amidase AmpD
MRRRRLLLALVSFSILFAACQIVRLAMAQFSPLPLAYAYIPSPNCDDRPPDALSISCVVLHATVEPTTEGTVHIFLDPARKVSAHFVVGKDGRVVQMVPVEKRAWHAGVSVLDGVPSVNDYSVGIEIVNLNDGKDPFPDAQLQAVAGILRLLRSRYAIPDARIVSHAQIALPPGRKSDPLGLDFDKIRTLAREDASAIPMTPPVPDTSPLPSENP